MTLFFYQIHAHEHDWFFQNFRENSPLYQFFTYDVIFDPKMTKFWQFPQKMTYFEEIEHINDSNDHIKVHKSGWDNF